MKNLIVNLAEATCCVRHEILDGRSHLVVPVVALIAGVLNQEYVPAAEIAASVAQWNDTPVPFEHPRERGVPISARQPAVLERAVAGRFYGANIGPDGRLRGEMWLDVAKATSLGYAETLALLEAGAPVEVSTAYFRDLETVAGDFNGKPYIGIARNLRPDHLALLPHGQGACSWQDGCGAPRVNEEVNLETHARTPDYDGTETTPWGNVDKTFAAYRAAYYKFSGAATPDVVPATCADAPAAMQRWIASKSLLGDAAATDFGQVCFFPVVNPGTNKLNAGALRAVLSGRGAQADIPAAQLEAARSKARALLDKEFTEGRMEENAKRDGEQTPVINQTPVTPVVPVTTPAVEPAPVANADLVALQATIVEFGGVAALREALTALRVNVEQERTELVRQLTANAQLTADEMELVPTTALRKLNAALRPADYSGRGGPRTNDANDGWQVLQAPEVK